MYERVKGLLMNMSKNKFSKGNPEFEIGFKKELYEETKDVLTLSECKLLEQVALGLNNAKISRMMYISEHTVKARIGVIFRKLRAQNRANAVYKAVKAGIIS